jgi:Flp pilus assembly protein TadD
MHLRHSRSGLPDLEGFDRLDLEGDPIVPTPDAIASLRPFGRDLPDQSLGRPTDPGQTPEQEMVVRARTLGLEGRRLDAVQILRQFLGDPTEGVDARVLLADLLADGGDLEGATDEMSRAIANAPKDPDLLTRRGALYARTGRVTDAEQDFLDATKHDPTYGPAYRYLGITRLRRGRIKEGISALQRARELAPDDAEATLHLGEAVAAQGQVEEALGILQRAAALCPSDPRAFKLLGRLLDRLGRTDEAMAMHKKSREVSNA